MEQPEKLIGRLLDERYQLHAVIGTGGSAVVFRGEDLLLRRTVAIKMLRSCRAPDTGDSAPAVDGEGKTPLSEKARRRAAERDAEAARLNRAAFRREGMAAAVLSHPNIVTVYDVSPECENPYIVMEYIEGTSLAALCEGEGVLTPEKLLFVTHGVLEALEEAHSHGIVHRDIKPENIMLTRDGGIKVTDFGIARIGGGEERLSGGRVLGTADTISPEQAGGKRVDARSDLYSLGAVMYRMATGFFPFTADDPDTLAFLHVSEPPKYPSTLNPTLPAGLEQIILTALEKQPDRRFVSATAMLRAVERLQADPGHVFRRFGRGGPHLPAVLTGARGALLPILLGVTVAFLLGGMLLFWRGQDTRPPVSVVEVPACCGEIVTVPEDLSLDDRIRVRFVRVVRPDLAPGTVIDQSPAAGMLWKLDGPDDSEELVLTVATDGESP